MHIVIEKLPPYEQISHATIREAAASLDAAGSARGQARKDLVELEQTREQAEWADAEAVERARAEDKPEPKRTHVAAHDRKTDEARHELKVSELAERRAVEELEDALEQHGAAWAAEVAEAFDTLRGEWEATVGELIGLHARLNAAQTVARAVGGSQPGVGAIGLKPGQIGDLEVLSGQHGKLGWVGVPDVLALLSELGVPKPDPAPQQHRPPRGPGGDPELLAHAGVRREIDERRAFDAANA